MKMLQPEDKLNRNLRDGLQIIGFWVIFIALGILFAKSYEYKKAAYPRAVCPVINTTCVEKEDGFFLAPSKYTEQRFTVKINNEIVTLTSRHDVIIPGMKVQTYFDGFQWNFEKVVL